MTVGDYILWHTPGHFRYGWVTEVIGNRITIRCVDHREPQGWLITTVDAGALRIVSAVPERQVAVC